MNFKKNRVLKLWCIIMAFSYLQSYANSEHVFFVILAGGDGERLWPLSRKNKPKQLLSLYGNKTLLEQAVERASLLASSKENIWVTTSASHEVAVRECVGSSVGTILVEPSARNTAAAIVFSCEQIYQRDPSAHVVFLPADPFIPSSEYEFFIDGIERALQFINKQESIVIFGIKPHYPTTSYGYIEYAQESEYEDLGIKKVINFHEKPLLSIAQHYLKKPCMLWNLSMFCTSVEFFLKEAELHCPAIVSGVRAACYNSDYYHTIDSAPIDKAIIEKSENIYVIPMDFIWYDVGNVGVFLSLREKANEEQKNVIQINAHNNLVNVPNKLVALVDVDNLCVVETDDALLISSRDTVENVKQLVTLLKKEGRNNYL